MKLNCDNSMGHIVAVHPSIKNMFMILLPNTLPKAMPGLFLRAAFTDTASSGNELPADTIVIPITASESPIAIAILVAASTKI